MFEQEIFNRFLPPDHGSPSDRLRRIEAKLDAVLECLICPICQGKGWGYVETYSESTGMMVGGMATCECRKKAAALVSEAN